MKQLNKLSYFDIDTLALITGTEGNNLYKNISRWLAQNKIVRLKRGFYVAMEYLNRVNNKSSYLEFISNKLRYPSYLSLEYVLSQNQVLSESVYTYTSITLKSTREYKNDLGRFIYKNTSKKLYTGFEIVSKGAFSIATASKSKALFDYLYLKFYRKEKITQENIESLRLNLDNFTTKDIKEFGLYCKLSNIKKYIKLSKTLFD